MFKLTQSPKFWAKVEIEVTAEDGRRTAVDFDLEYKRLSHDEAVALGERIESGNGDVREIVREIVTGWRRVAGDDGSTLDWSTENFETLLNFGFAKAIFDTFTKNLPRARVKN